jgi:hypothetical protein
MKKYLSLDEVIILHEYLINEFGAANCRALAIIFSCFVIIL